MGLEAEESIQKLRAEMGQRFTSLEHQTHLALVSHIANNMDKAEHLDKLVDDVQKTKSNADWNQEEVKVVQESKQTDLMQDACLHSLKAIAEETAHEAELKRQEEPANQETVEVEVLSADIKEALSSLVSRITNVTANKPTFPSQGGSMKMSPPERRHSPSRRLSGGSLTIPSARMQSPDIVRGRMSTPSDVQGQQVSRASSRPTDFQSEDCSQSAVSGRPHSVLGGSTVLQGGLRDRIQKVQGNSVELGVTGGSQRAASNTPGISNARTLSPQPQRAAANPSGTSQARALSPVSAAANTSGICHTKTATPLKTVSVNTHVTARKVSTANNGLAPHQVCSLPSNRGWQQGTIQPNSPKLAYCECAQYSI